MKQYIHTYLFIDFIFNFFTKMILHFFIQLQKYISTKFFRFLVSLRKVSQDNPKDRFSFVPIQNYDEEWTDEKLYKKYGLDESEINFIESKSELPTQFHLSQTSYTACFSLSLPSLFMRTGFWKGLGLSNSILQRVRTISEWVFFSVRQ